MVEPSGAVEIEGDAVRLDARRALSMALALHELATNAGKYGSLSGPRGIVEIAWGVQGGEGTEERFFMAWREQDGPPISAPDRKGFGSLVISTMIERNLDADVVLEHASTGLTWQMHCEAARILEADGAKPHKAERRARSTEERGNGRPRVLIVEDEWLLSMELTQLLGEAGYHVLGPAQSLDQAMQVLHTSSCDAAILDIHLGRETAEPIARELLSRNTPFISVTGYSRDQQPAIFRSAPLLSKPLLPATLLKELAACLGEPAAPPARLNGGTAP
jgi:CheY-like chemotaxis protein